MKTYKVIGGYTVYEQYEINVQAKDDKDAIKNAEVDGKHKKMRKLLDWFSKNFTDEYYTLLD